MMRGVEKKEAILNRLLYNINSQKGRNRNKIYHIHLEQLIIQVTMTR